MSHSDEWAMGDKVGGDKVGGDKVGGDKITYIVNQPSAHTSQRAPLHLLAPPSPPHSFIKRSAEFEQLVALLTNTSQLNHVGITVTLRGAGGYGKTTLAQAICQDERVRSAYPDGRFWVTLGEGQKNLSSIIVDLVWKLTNEQLNFRDLPEAISALDTALDERACLLVIDDVWSAADLHPFLQGGPRCTRLITTRDEGTLPSGTAQILIGKMQADQALSLLCQGLVENSDEHPRLEALVQLLGAWPLLLALVNGALVDELKNKALLLRIALDTIIQKLDEKGLIAFDATNPDERRLAAARTIEVSLERLGRDLFQRYIELSIFPEDIDIPLSIVKRLWGATGTSGNKDTEEICKRLERLSLLLEFISI